MEDVPHKRRLELDLVDHAATPWGLDPSHDAEHQSGDRQDHEQSVLHQNLASSQKHDGDQWQAGPVLLKPIKERLKLRDQKCHHRRDDDRSDNP